MGNDKMKNLQSEVEGVKNIMTQNVERILARGENLDHLRNKTEDLEATVSSEAQPGCDGAVLGRGGRGRADRQEGRILVPRPGKRLAASSSPQARRVRETGRW